ncbi:hypothetical protein SAMN05444395_102136 [Flavobacterium fryxellicola]|uniref:Uncharacterized protein n=1 Tax=Flavobacterium fryxellicola TaxID=249352 RepID=A0A167Y7B3_9FLAO|nr:hypothetical protein [Flavobacterium fryxellicola]OAB29096.1 hypothetical protein FBFR_06520 [Flavobacterium fryxellicola]SHN58493.1 hypothetical protein SAMN05444395_102136 [Flavobacterium fryxellicola]
MEKIQKIQLTKGSFTNEEAKEVLFNLINTKINFHNLKNFSSDIRSGTADEAGLKRVIELTEAKATIDQIISYATKENLKIKIDTDILITIE